MQQRTYYSKDAKNRAQTERTMLAALFLSLGLTVGAILALLFAPVSGEEARDTVSETADTLRGEVEKRVKAIS